MIIKAIVDFLNDYNRDITIVFITILSLLFVQNLLIFQKQYPLF